jgi:hypothetical protein
MAGVAGLVVNASTMRNDVLTVDFSSGGTFTLAEGLHFKGNAQKTNTLNLNGTDGNDHVVFSDAGNDFNALPLILENVNIVHFDGGEGEDTAFLDGDSSSGSFLFKNGAASYQTSIVIYTTTHVEKITLDAKTGIDTAYIIGTESSSIFNVVDNFLTMLGGGYRLELKNFNTIDATATGHCDKTYVYGEKNSLIVMNDLYVERRGDDQFYRVWHSENVIAINNDDTNNTILHMGSRGYDSYTVTQCYGTACNAIGSYHHEFIDFKNVIIFSPFMVAKVSLPTATGFTQQTDRGVWTQNGYSVTVSGHAELTTRDGSTLPQETAAPLVATPVMETIASETNSLSSGTPAALTQAASPRDKTVLPRDEPASTSKAARLHDREGWDDNLFAFLAEEQIRQHKKKDRPFGQDDDARTEMVPLKIRPEHFSATALRDRNLIFWRFLFSSILISQKPLK